MEICIFGQCYFLVSPLQFDGQANHWQLLSVWQENACDIAETETILCEWLFCIKLMTQAFGEIHRFHSK